MKNLPFVASFQQWWQSVSPREQKMLMVCAALGAIAILYWGILDPIYQQAEAAKQKARTEQQLYSWTKNKANENYSASLPKSWC